MHKVPQFIGITDFLHPMQVELMSRTHHLAMSRVSKPRPDLHLAVGVMTSAKMVLGMDTRWSQAFPALKEIEAIFAVERNKLYRVLHYADYENVEFERCLELATTYGGPRLQAIQLDMTWPDRAVLGRHHQKHPALATFLQAGKAALERVGNDPKKFVQRLTPYLEESLVDAVLLDRSMGRGVEMDPNVLRGYIEEIRARYPKLHLIVAGGLGPYSLDQLRPLWRQFPWLSIDAQSRLRPSHNALDPVNWNMAGDYVEAAIGMWAEERAKAGS